MPEDLPVTRTLVIPAAELRERFSRSSGPGGQGVNTADSRVELVADLTELTGPDDVVERVRAKLGDSIRIVAKAERSQLRNREDALERLAERLDAAARPKRPRTPTRPSAAADRRRVETKRQRSKLKAMRRPPPDES